MKKIKQAFLVVLSLAMLVTNSSAVKAGVVEYDIAPITKAGETVTDDLILINKGTQVIYMTEDGDIYEDMPSAARTGELYDLKIEHIEYYSRVAGFIYVLDISCNNKKCQISKVEGEVIVRASDDYEYGEPTAIYVKNYPPTYRIAAEGGTGVIITSGTPDIYLAYEFYVSLVNGVILGGGKFNFAAGPFVVP